MHNTTLTQKYLRFALCYQLTAVHNVATPADWRRGADVIVNFPLTDAQATEKFGEEGDGWKVVALPSEADGNGVWMPDKHYLRSTKDPLASTSNSPFSLPPACSLS